MKKKILVSVAFLLILIFAIWFSQPAIRIVAPKNGITIVPGDTLNFEVWVRWGHCPDFVLGFLPINLYQFCRKIGFLPIDFISFANEEDLNYDPNIGWLEFNPNGQYYPVGNKDKPTSISFNKPGKYKLVALGNFNNIIAGSEIAAKSAPITVNVVGPLKWKTVNDAERLFSIQIPGEWFMSPQTTSNIKDPKKTKQVNFFFIDGTYVFTINIYPVRFWNDNMATTQTIILAKTPEYIFTAYVPNNTIPDHYGFTDAQIRETLPRIFSSFKSLK